MNQLTKDKFLNKAELLCLNTILDNDSSRDSLFITLALNTGARVSELLDLRVSDLNHDDEAVYIRGLKNSFDRSIPIKPDLYNRLRRYASTIKTDRVFNISYDRIYQIWQGYKPSKKKFHSLRHTFAVELYKKTKDIKLVQTALGHKSLTNTMIYMNYVYSIEELKKLIL